MAKSNGSGGFNGDDSIELAAKVKPVPTTAKNVGNDPNDGVGLGGRRKGSEQ